MLFLFAALSAYLVGFLLTPILISVLRKMNLGDKPGGRKIHKKFIPSMGGIAFVVAASVSLAIWGWQFPLPDIRYLLGAISLMFFVGLRDDMVELKATHKLLGQLVAVILVVVISDIRIQHFHGFLGIGELNIYVSYAFSTFVLLVLTNAFNLIDGLDGLAGTSGALALLALGFWFAFQGLDSYALLSFIFLGAILAFLFFNWYPAKIFMGDTGSLTLGFVIGALIIAFMETNSKLPEGTEWKFKSVFSAGITLMIFPLFDMARVFARRIKRGKGPMTPDKSHIHHFLMRMGLKHNQVTLIMLAVQVFFITILIVLKDYSDHLVMPLIAFLALVMGWRLDQVALKFVRKKIEKEPRVLELRPIKDDSQNKIKLERSDFERTDINLN
jgi:UDP-N-acetylmuramyl pentapeptide phosphotransferase/UDP-N-acetylglucosamine-1-phosphate transferase